jgi:hypothetical protein
MNTKDLFSDETARKIWNQYFRRISRLAAVLPAEQQDDLKKEIQDHLYESFNQEGGDKEAERLLNVIEKIGEPEQYIKPMVADRLLHSASRTFNPVMIIKGLYYNMFGNLKQFFLTLAFSFGYLMAFFFGLLAVLEIFFPHNVGIFLSRDGVPAVGVIMNEPEYVKADVLGYWSIVIEIVLSFLLFFALTRKLKVIKKKT